MVLSKTLLKRVTGEIKHSSHTSPMYSITLPADGYTVKGFSFTVSLLTSGLELPNWMTEVLIGA